MGPSQGNVWSPGGDNISAVINFQQQTRRFLFNLVQRVEAERFTVIATTILWVFNYMAITSRGDCLV